MATSCSSTSWRTAKGSLQHPSWPLHDTGRGKRTAIDMMLHTGPIAYGLKRQVGECLCAAGSQSLPQPCSWRKASNVRAPCTKQTPTTAPLGQVCAGGKPGDRCSINAPNSGSMVPWPVCSATHRTPKLMWRFSMSLCPRRMASESSGPRRVIALRTHGAGGNGASAAADPVWLSPPFTRAPPPELAVNPTPRDGGLVDMKLAPNSLRKNCSCSTSVLFATRLFHPSLRAGAGAEGVIALSQLAGMFVHLSMPVTKCQAHSWLIEQSPRVPRHLEIWKLHRKCFAATCKKTRRHRGHPRRGIPALAARARASCRKNAGLSSVSQGPSYPCPA